MTQRQSVQQISSQMKAALIGQPRYLRDLSVSAAELRIQEHTAGDSVAGRRLSVGKGSDFHFLLPVRLVTHGKSPPLRFR